MNSIGLPRIPWHFRIEAKLLCLALTLCTSLNAVARSSDYYGMRLHPSKSGIRVVLVYRNGPADRAGIKAGDYIKQIDGKPAESVYPQIGHEVAPGTKAEIVLHGTDGNLRNIHLIQASEQPYFHENGSVEVASSTNFLELSEGQLAPDMTAGTRSNETVSLNSLRGKVVLLHFTATWCGPCKRQLPPVKQSYQRLKPKGFEIVSVFCDTDRPKVDAYLEEQGIAWPIYFDGKGWQSQPRLDWGPVHVPSYALIGRDGRILKLGIQLKEMDAMLVAAVSGKL